MKKVVLSLVMVFALGTAATFAQDAKQVKKECCKKEQVCTKENKQDCKAETKDCTKCESKCTAEKSCTKAKCNKDGKACTKAKKTTEKTTK